MSGFSFGSSSAATGSSSSPFSLGTTPSMFGSTAPSSSSSPFSISFPASSSSATSSLPLIPPPLPLLPQLPSAYRLHPLPHSLAPRLRPRTHLLRLSSVPRPPPHPLRHSSVPRARPHPLPFSLVLTRHLSLLRRCWFAVDWLDNYVVRSKFFLIRFRFFPFRIIVECRNLQPDCLYDRRWTFQWQLFLGSYSDLSSVIPELPVFYFFQLQCCDNFLCFVSIWGCFWIIRLHDFYSNFYFLIHPGGLFCGFPVFY